jgi:hypothetical protein
VPPRKKKETRPDGAVVVLAPDASLEDKVDQAYWLRNDRYMSWEEIATTLDYASAASARVAVHQYIQRAAANLTASRRQAVLDHEMAIYDRIETVLTPRMLDGDLKAIETLMKASMNRAKLQGLLDIEHEKDGNRTVVVSVEKFAETMKAIALEAAG